MDFFEWNFNISFCLISNPSFYLNKNELRKNCLGKSIGERYDAWYLLFGICTRTSHTPKFWNTYVITYGYFMIIVEPCTFLVLSYYQLQFVTSQPEITCSKLTETHQNYAWHHSGVFIFNFEHISLLAAVLLLSTLSR